jgi:acyl-CoA thioesterase FadM
MLLRFFAAVLGSLRRPRVALLDEVVTRHRCRPSDCDANLHMNDGRYLTVSGVARVALMVRVGLWPHFRARRWRPVAGAADVRYFREIRPFAPFTVRSRIVTWDEKYFYFEQVFELTGRGEPVTAARVLVRGLFRGPAGPVPTAEVLAALGFAGARPEPGEELALWMELAELVKRRRNAP